MPSYLWKGGEGVIDFEEVYQDYLEDVYRFSLALCRDPVLAEELTQETFFRALEHIGQFRGSAPCGSGCARSPSTPG